MQHIVRRVHKLIVGGRIFESTISIHNMNSHSVITLKFIILGQSGGKFGWFSAIHSVEAFHVKHM